MWVGVYVLQVSVYQLLNGRKMDSALDKRLLSSRLMPIHSSGWEVFSITQAVSADFISQDFEN